MNSPRICILSFSTIAIDARVLRQIKYAARGYCVDVIGYGRWHHPQSIGQYWQIHRTRTPCRKILRGIGVPISVLPGLGKNGLFLDREFREAYQILLRGNYQLIHANELMALPPAVAASKKTESKLIFDAHEYSLDQAGKGRILNKLHRYILQSFGRSADAYITVSEGIAALYRRNLNVDPIIVMNAPEFQKIQFHPTDHFNIKIVHHGNAAPQRNLDLLIEVASLLDARYSFHFMLIGGNPAYVDHLKKLAATKAPEKVTFHSPVTPDRIVNELSQYDMGIHILLPDVLNHKFALPNKLFDFIAAGLAVVTGPLPEMAKMVQQFDLGVVASAFEPVAIARAINGLTPIQIDAMRNQSLAASESLNAETEMRKLTALYQRVLNA